MPYAMPVKARKLGLPSIKAAALAPAKASQVPALFDPTASPIICMPTPIVAPIPSEAAHVPALTRNASVPSSRTSETQPILLTAVSPICSNFAVTLGANFLLTLSTRLMFAPNGASALLKACISMPGSRSSQSPQ